MHKESSGPGRSEPSREGERRLQDLNAFARGLTHDLRNPLNVILTNAYLLRQRLPEDDARGRRVVGRIEEQVQAAIHILEGVEAFDLLSEPRPQSVSVNDAVRTALQDLSLSDETHFEFETDEDLPPVLVDPRLLTASVRALLRNASRAGRGGEVVIRTVRQGDMVRLTVEDSGPGVAEEDLPRVFEPFFSRWEEHAGLGLTLVQRTARVSGGTARLESLPTGARATMELPVRRVER